VGSTGSGAQALAGPGVSSGASAPGAVPLLDASPAPGAPSSAPVSQSPASGYGVDLQQTIEAVHATIALASRRGLSQARIALAPEELGEIRIHLSQSASGLVARITASTAAAAQALTEGRAELRSSLSSLGLTSLHLDTGAFESGSQREGRAAPHSAASSSSARQAPDVDDESDAPSLDPPSDPTPIARLSRGALVDVLA
jgi:flagellar hook-length control protein FliK